MEIETQITILKRERIVNGDYPKCHNSNDIMDVIQNFDLDEIRSFINDKAIVTIETREIK